MSTARSSSHLLGVVSALVHAGIPPLGLGLDTPPGCGPGDPPTQPDPPTSPWVWAWRPPWTEFLTHASENITLP